MYVDDDTLFGKSLTDLNDYITDKIHKNQMLTGAFYKAEIGGKINSESRACVIGHARIFYSGVFIIDQTSTLYPNHATLGRDRVQQKKAMTEFGEVVRLSDDGNYKDARDKLIGYLREYAKEDNEFHKVGTGRWRKGLA